MQELNSILESEQSTSSERLTPFMGVNVPLWFYIFVLAELPPPDLLIVHPLLYPSVSSSLFSKPMLPPPLELYGFPPWQIRVTEF